MPKQYEVLELSFINGQLYQPGEKLVLEIDSPGGNLKQLGSRASAAGNAGTDAAAAEYTAKHNGGGRFIILDKAGERFGEFTGNKDETETEAARLNAGGDAGGDAAGNAGTEQGPGNLPDA
ncbi:hypothetical protein ACI77I_22000 [Pseudomonas sp. D47]|uniref:hypothetical protein n=1 Tax=Pseudomonas sp. D47 TaxID=3159447 RepID=UPI00387AF120